MAEIIVVKWYWTVECKLLKH